MNSGSRGREGRASTWCAVAFVCAASAVLVSGCSRSSGRTAGATGASAASEKTGKDAISVKVTAVSLRPVSSVYSTSATLRAEKQATVIARTQGVIRRLVVEEGAGVAAGQVLAELENDEQRIDFDKAVTTRDTKAKEYERAEKLYARGLLSDEAHAATRRDAEDARQAAALAELSLGRTTIRAPFTGRVLKRYLDVGASVANGTSIYDVADLDPLFVDVTVPERHVARLKPGQAVRVVSDASGQIGAAAIERIAPGVDPATGTIKVTLSVPAASGLRPGGFVGVDIILDTHSRALVVPRSALVAEGRSFRLYRLQPDGVHVEEAEARLGYEEGDQVEVLDLASPAAPLAAGQKVVSLGASALSAGSLVHVMNGEADRPGQGVAKAGAGTP